MPQPKCIQKSTFPPLLFSLWAVSLGAVLCYGQQSKDSTELGSTMTVDQLKGIKKPPTLNAPSSEIPVFSAAAEPKPALQYRFYPTFRQLKAGSAHSYFSRAVYSYYQVPDAERKKWNEYLVAKGNGKDNVDDLKKLLVPFQQTLNELNEFRVCDDMHWDYRIRDLKGTDMFKFTLPEAHVAREMARIIKADAMIHIANKDYPRLINSIQTGFRLAEFMGKGETVIQKLVGTAIESVIDDVILQAMQVPDCPNFYWALATVPQPLIKMQSSLRFELDSGERIFPVIEQAETLTLDEAGWRKMWQESISQFQELNGMNGGIDSSRLTASAFMLGINNRNAPERLIKYGIPKEKIDGMFPEQILALDALYELRTISHELNKQALLPFHIDKQWLSTQERKVEALLQNDSFAAAISRLLLPAIRQVRVAETRAQMVHDRLMTIEAIRMHLATHKNVPKALSDLVDVPAIQDPFSNQSFEYASSETGEFFEVTLNCKDAEPETWYKEIKFRLRK